MNKKNEQPTSIKNMKLANDIFEFCYTVKKHQLKIKHPEFDERKLHDETMKIINEACK